MALKNKLLFEAIRPNLICPITGQYFLDPVTIPSGITYEKTAILLYFSETNGKKYLECPVTRMKIFDYDLNPRSDGSIKDLNPNLNIKRIINQLIKDCLIDQNELFRSHLFEMPISKRCFQMDDFEIPDSDIDAFCNELRYSEYSIRELYDGFHFYFSSSNTDFNRNASTLIFNAIIDHVNHDRIKGVDEFIAFIKFCIRCLFLKDYNLNFIINTFELEYIPSELFFDNNLLKVLSFGETFKKLLKYREREIIQFIGYLSNQEWTIMIQNILFFDDKSSTKTSFESINYNFLIYLSEKFPVTFNDNFSPWINSFSHIIMKRTWLSHDELKFIHIVRTRFPLEFQESFNSEILNLLLDKYDIISNDHLHVIGWYDIDNDVYTLKINPNYQNSVESMYLNRNNAFWLFGAQSLVKQIGDKTLSFRELEEIVEVYRSNDKLEIDSIEQTYKYRTKIDMKIANFEDL